MADFKNISKQTQIVKINIWILYEFQLIIYSNIGNCGIEKLNLYYFI